MTDDRSVVPTDDPVPTVDDAVRARSLRVAAVQMPCRLGAIDDNLAAAGRLADDAASQGARLILFPELMSSGYAWDAAAWSAAEPTAGPTARWLADVARTLGVWVGTSYLEAAGADFWNTFVLAAPGGSEAGRVRKEFPSMDEARVFRGAPGSHVIETPIGRIGVGICFDAHTAVVARALMAADVDLVLAPHCYCVPREASRLVSRKDIGRLVDTVAGIAPSYARLLGVPAVVTNRVGDWDVPKGSGFVFPGQATIADSDGAVRGHLADTAGVLVADVALDPARKVHTAVPAFGRYIYPGPPGRELLRLIEWRGRRQYEKSAARRSRARSVSSAARG